MQLQPTDGVTLQATATASVDLVHAQKVFPTMPTIVQFGYLEEMARVTRPGGFVVFDMLTERCLDDATLARWFAARLPAGPYPSATPRELAVAFLARREVHLTGSFLIATEPGITECMVFVRRNQC